MTFDGCRSDTQNVCCLFNGEAAEVAQLNHTRLLFVERCQGFKRVVERNQFGASFDCTIDVFVQREFLKILATLFRIVLARMIHKQATHYLCSNPEKVSAILPVHPRLIDEFHISLMNQSGWLQGVIRTFAPQIIRRKLSQFIVDDR